MPDIEDRNPSESESENEPREANVRRSESESQSESDQSEDELQRKAIGGYGGDTGEAAARWAPSKSRD